jgi:gliding motility-associated-like protein
VGNPENITVTVKPGPVLALNQTTAICSGDQVNYEILLNPANTPAGTTLSWPDPDGSGPAKSKFNVAADPVGTRHITDTLYNGTGAPLNVVYSVIAKGLNGCNGVVRDVTVVVNPGAVVEAGNPQAVCSNGTVTLVGSSIGGLATQGTWDIILNPSGGDGAITQTDPTDPDGATFKATVAGNYTLRLTTDDPDGPGGCSAASDVVVITVRPVGDPSCTGGSGTCATVSIVPVPTPATCSNSDGSVFFNINPPLPVTGDVKITIDGTGSTVLPSPRTNFASIDGFTFDVLAVGTYSYVIEYGDASCTKTGVFSIDRSGTVGTATVSNLINPTCFSGTGTATIDVPGETGNILQWTANGIDFHNFVVGNPVSGLPAGLIAINRAGDPCAAGVFINFVVPDDIPLTFVATDASCNGNDGTIEVINYTAGEDPYVFDINGTQTNMPADSVFRGFTADTYTIAVTDNKGCTKTYAPLIIRQIVGPGTLDTLYVHKGISVPDLPSGSALVGVNPSGLEPYETRLELTEPLFASQSFFSDWAEVPVNPLSLKFEQSYTNLFAGVYELGLRDAGGCTKNYVLIIDMDTQLFIPNIFTPNEDGHNDVFYIRNLPTESRLLVTNRWGKEVFKSSSYQNDWNGGDTVDGMYYYTLTLGSQSFSGWVEILRGQ